jgi:signal transduction histidine kinase
VRIRDHGPGIPAEHQSRVFDRFYRGTGTSRSRGLGLGLSIAKAILTSQGGGIRLQSRAGAGCCFTLALRLAPDARHEATSSEPERIHLPDVPISSAASSLVR